MAYRKLVDGDLVRITDKNHSGRNAIVIESGETMSRVQIHSWSHLHTPEPSVCVIIDNDKLMVRHEPNGYIIDGRIDHDKKSAFDKIARDQDLYLSEEPEEDEFDDVDRDGLIDMIIKLRNDVSTLSENQI